MATLPLFVVPIRTVSTLCTVEQGRLMPINPVPIPVEAEWVMSEDGWIAWSKELPGDVLGVGIWHCDADPQEQQFPTLLLPKRMDPLALAFLDGRLLAVTHLDGSLLVCPLQEASFEWSEVGGSLTRFDRMAVQGSDLYLAGYEGTQKRLWRCRIDADQRLQVLATTEVARRGNSDSFEKLAIGPRLALHEEAFGFAEESCHLSLFHPQSLFEEVELVSIKVNSMLVYGNAGQPVPDAAHWSAPVWVDDVLVVPSGPRGLGLLHFRPPEPAALQYQAMPAEVVRVVSVPHTRTMVAVMRMRDGLDSHLLELAAQGS